MSPHDKHGPSSHNDQAILQAYGVLTALHAIERAPIAQMDKPVLINDILAYIKGRNGPQTARVELALVTQLPVRRQYKHLLRLNRIAHIARPRAAHSGAVFDLRIGEHGVRLMLKQSKGHPQQHYLIIELPENITSVPDKPLVLHANTDTLTQRAVFPPVHDRRSQIILSADDDLFSLLQHHDVEIDIQ